MIEPPDLRPLALGELIDRAARFWRRHWRSLFAIYLPFQLSLYALLKAYGGVVQRHFPYALGGAPAMEATKTAPFEVLADMGRAMAVLVPTMAIYWIVASFAALAAGRFVASNVIGPPHTVVDSFKWARSRMGTLLASCGLVAAWGVGAGIASMLPGAAIGALSYLGRDSSTFVIAALVVGTLVAIAGLLICALWWFLRFLLVTQVVAVEEDVTARGAIRRAGELISGRVGPGFLGRVMVRATILITASVAILWTAQFITSVPKLVLTFIYANPLDPAHADLSKIPSLLLLPAELLQVVAQSFLAPLYISILAFLYLDLRIRREGLDLELRLAAL